LKKLITNSAKHAKKSMPNSKKTSTEFFNNYSTTITESTTTSAYSSPADFRQLENFILSTHTRNLSLFLTNYLLLNNLELPSLKANIPLPFLFKASFNNNYTLQSFLANSTNLQGNTNIFNNKSILIRSSSALPVRKSLQNLISVKNLSQA
jgi:hypothetical protein